MRLVVRATAQSPSRGAGANRQALQHALLRRRMLSSSYSATPLQRLAALGKLQADFDALELLEAKRSHQRILVHTIELRARQAAILAGETLTDEETALPPLSENDLADIPSELEESLDSFWL